MMVVSYDTLGKIPVRVVAPGDRVYKDECAYTFTNPESDDGLYVSLFSFLGFSKHYATLYSKKTGFKAFLSIRRIRFKNDGPVEPAAPKRLAIGLEGGFPLEQNQFRVEESVQIQILPEGDAFQLDDPKLPTQLRQSAESVKKADGAFKTNALSATSGTWDGEARVTSKHGENLKQLDNGVKIPPRGWKCSRCDLSENLWLNMTDGAINCGRKFFDGSGGNNHAIDHYKETKFPLAVKLGTINYKGADVYSYDEDDMVIDCKLEKHLAHFGIDVAAMQKTEKSMAELELDMNQRIGEWALCTEEGCTLVPVYGPGYTGLHNMGNSCYMNSVVQLLFTVPNFVRKYKDDYSRIIDNCTGDPNTDLKVQMAKLAHGILSGEFSKAPKSEVDSLGIRPQSFKNVVGYNHAEFSSMRQQDAEEYFRYLLDLLEKNDKTSPVGDIFRFQVEERIECGKTKKVAYKKRTEFILGLMVPMDAASNRSAVEAYEAKKKQAEDKGERIDPKEMVLSKIPLIACLSTFVTPEYVEDYYSSAAKCKVTAKKSALLLNFPDFLLIQIKKFTLTENWTPKKLDISLDVPDELDLSALRAPGGLQPGEEQMPRDEAPGPQIDQSVVKQLAEMGFPLEGCKKAVYHTKNSGVEAAMQWVMEHMADADFGDPFVVVANKPDDGFKPDESSVQMVMGMGFTRPQALRALKETQNNVERAIDWIFSHQDELNAPPAQESGSGEQTQHKLTDGDGKYRLVGFITHMGSSTSSGHYVCHLLREKRWVIYNDEKVALSEKPPKDMAYLYLYQRCT